MIVYNELREENDNFSKSYNLAKTFKFKTKTDKIVTASSFQMTFVDLINKYEEKQYKVTDLSLKNNLFEPSPLLLENNKIVDYYRFGDNTKIYEKDLKFLVKTNAQINDKAIDNEERRKHLPSKQNLIDNFCEDPNKKPKTKIEYLNDIKANKLYIRTATMLMEEDEFKDIFDDTKLETINESIRDLPRIQKKAFNSTKLKNKPKLEKIKKYTGPITIKSKIILDEKKRNFDLKELSTINNSILSTDQTTIRDRDHTAGLSDLKANNIIVKDNDLFTDENEEERLQSKEEIFDEINNSIEKHGRINRVLESTFDKVLVDVDPVNAIFEYYEKSLGKDRKNILENMNKLGFV